MGISPGVNESCNSSNGSVLEGSIQKNTIEQTMEVLPYGKRRLAAQLRTTVKASSLWKVLTDYENLNKCIPNLSLSEIIKRNGNIIQLRQIGSQNLFGLRFSAEVQLELIEDKSKGKLTFYLLKGDFRCFEGSWQVRYSHSKQSSLLLYELTVQGCIGMPVALIEKRLRGDLKTNLLAVEKAAMSF